MRFQNPLLNRLSKFWAIRKHGDYTSPLTEQKISNINLPSASLPPHWPWAVTTGVGMTRAATTGAATMMRRPTTTFGRLLWKNELWCLPPADGNFWKTDQTPMINDVEDRPNDDELGWWKTDLQWVLEAPLRKNGLHQE